MLEKGIKFCIDDTLYFSIYLLNFTDIHQDGHYFGTNNEGSDEYLYITKINLSWKHILKKLLAYLLG